MHGAKNIKFVPFDNVDGKAPLASGILCTKPIYVRCNTCSTTATRTDAKDPSQLTEFSFVVRRLGEAR